MKSVTFDYSKLRGRIKERFGTEKIFAEKMGMSQQALSSRLNNKTEFADEEIYTGQQILDFDVSEIGKYFFTPKVQKNRTNETV